MSLEYIDGFDYADDNAGLVMKGWGPTVEADSSITINPTAGRNGSGALEMAGSSSGADFNWCDRPITPTATLVVGARCKSDVFSTTRRRFFYFREGGSAQLELCLEPNGNLSVRRNDTVLETSTQALSAATFYYIEFKAAIDNTNGSYEVRVDGVTWLSATGVDTQNTANASIDQFRLATMSDSGDKCYFDDLYLANTAGSVNNDFLGDVKVDLVLPDADGAHTDFSPLSGSDHFAMVNQNPPDGDTTYNHSDTVGHTDSYGFAALPATAGSVLGLQVAALARKEDAGERGIKVLARPGSTDQVSGNKSLSVDYTYSQHLWENNPDTGSPWTKAEVDAAEFGVELSL